jgi:hypothetical protein
VQHPFRVSENFDQQYPVIALHGWLSGPAVDVVVNLVAAKKVPTVCLDLSQLADADRAGADALRQLQQAGARLRGTTPYLRLLLDRH